MRRAMQPLLEVKEIGIAKGAKNAENEKRVFLQDSS
jgi:hypothetical protein